MSDPRSSRSIPSPRILAELLRLQRWAGGDAVTADRIFGLMHGFETVIAEEKESFGISRETQSKVEDMLEDVERGKQSTDGYDIKQRLLEDQIDESTAAKVLELCRLQSRFTEAYEKLTAPESYFPGLAGNRLPERDWFGALHYVELIDCTEEAHKTMHSCFSPAVPREGEYVAPENGPPMRVVEVRYEMISLGDGEGQRQPILVPFVYLENEDDLEDEADDDILDELDEPSEPDETDEN